MFNLVQLELKTSANHRISNGPMYIYMIILVRKGILLSPNISRYVFLLIVLSTVIFCREWATRVSGGPTKHEDEEIVRITEHLKPKIEPVFRIHDLISGSIMEL